MTESQAIKAAKQYLQDWCRTHCHDFEAEFVSAESSILTQNRATWRVIFLEPFLGSNEDDVKCVYVDELTGEVWSVNHSTDNVTPCSWNDRWAEKRLQKMQKDWRKQVKKHDADKM